MNAAIKRALVSVTDKGGLDPFVRELSRRGVEIVASGGSARAITAAGVPVREIGDVTGFPEIMDGRVKTLHPKIHGGILADRDKRTHLEQAEKHGIRLIDLVVVNLYRFARAAANAALSEREIVEEIDIGGPALIRAAAKNYHSTAVVVDPSDYASVLQAMDENAGGVPLEMRRRLAAKAYFHTAAYDAGISRWFERLLAPEELPERRAAAYRKIRTLRYGENPHLRGALYVLDGAAGGLAGFEQIQGKELSYNNIQDLHAAFLLARDLGRSSCAIIKHMNPCGAAVSATAADSFRRARITDETSAFGSVVAVNDVADRAFAEACADIFLEVVVARGFDEAAIEILAKRKNLRLVSVPNGDWDEEDRSFAAREIGNLLLLQDRDEGLPELSSLTVATSRRPTPDEERALGVAWRIAKHVKSNAIVICNGAGTIGVGAGQMSRVDSCRIAVDKARRAGLAIEGTAAGSDAFFPFPDGIEVLAEAGVKAVIQPGGSIRDADVVATADRLGLAMVMTGRRHFRH
jgi:phosphoribosylaminoimidazolecarboxamide formyltransferase/IMP cyclohydrolase